MTALTVERLESVFRPAGARTVCTRAAWATGTKIGRSGTRGSLPSPRYQRTPINTEAKLLLLRHAFESLGCVRVEFKTDRLNEQSRAALKRIGVVEEGTFRRRMLTQSGRWRDSVYFSIVAEEWPSVRDALEAKLAR